MPNQKHACLRIPEVVALLLALAVPSLGSGAPRITRTDDSFAPVVMSYDDLRSLVRLARLQVQTLNAGLNPRYVTESLSIGRGSDTASFEMSADVDLAGAPDEASLITYTYRAPDEGARVSEISIRLADYSRTLTVAGEASEVQATWSVLSAELNRHSSSVRGRGWRLILNGAVLLLGLLLAWLPVGAGTEVERNGKKYIRLIYGGYRTMAVGVALIVVAWMLPSEGWLSGTVVVWGPTSVLQRYAAEIGFAGLALGVISLLPITQVLRKRQAERDRHDAPGSGSGAPEGDSGVGAPNDTRGAEGQK